MLARLGRLAASALALAVLAPLSIATPAGVDTYVVSSEKPGGFDYLVDQAVVDVDGTLTLVNLDLRSHDVVSVADGPADSPWCDRYAKRACPLFASLLLPFGAHGVVEGTHQLTPLSSYEFYCSIHPWMTGTLTAV